MFDFLSRQKQEPTVDPASVRALITLLGSDDRHARERAQRALVVVGAPAVAPVIELLASPDEHLRWEAAKVLSRICTPEATTRLVDLLEGGNSGLRWLAARGLIVAGRQGLPLLRAHARGVRQFS